MHPVNRNSILCLTALSLTAATISVHEAVSADFPPDAEVWQRLETLPPTPKGSSYLPGMKSGEWLQLRFATPKQRPARYLLNVDNVVALRGGGQSYQVEIHVDSKQGPLLYQGARFAADSAFNAEDLSSLDATAFLKDEHLRQGSMDLWVTVHVTGDDWTIYRDDDGKRWDMYARIPDPKAYARWQEEQRRREQMLSRGVCLIPQPQQLELLDTDLPLSAGLSLLTSGALSERDEQTVAWLSRELSRLAGADATRVRTRQTRQVRLLKASAAQAAADWLGFTPTHDLGDQGYALVVDADAVRIAAQGSAGMRYAAQTLLQLITGQPGRRFVHGVRITDWPDLPRRMAQYDVARGNTVDVEYFKHWIDELSRLKINELMLYMEDDWRSPGRPYLGRPDTLTPEKARELTAYAESRFVELVPQVESLGHATALLGHEELADLRLAGGRWAICPHAPGVLAFFRDLYSELCRALPQSRLFHVGGDEVWGFAADERCAEMVKESGEEGVYAFHLNNLQKLLAKLGRKMAFWGDEVLHYPRVADMLTRDSVVFDWHYGNQSSYPSIQFFQDRGFREIYVCPAVHGFFDVYPQYRQSFGNISGFVRAGVDRGVEGLCCTTWGMNRGGNAENYLYGLAYAAQCGWSSQFDEREFFDARFAPVWFGAPYGPETVADIDRAFWFAWREAPPGAFWQRLHRTGEWFFGPWEGFLDGTDAGQRATMEQHAQLLDKLCAEALTAIQRLRSNATRNHVTLDSLAHAVRVHRWVAGKCRTVAELARDYRSAYGRRPRQVEILTQALKKAGERVDSLRRQMPQLEAGIRDYVDRRGGDPNDLKLLARARTSLDAYAGRLQEAIRDAGQGTPPAPSMLALGYPFLARIGQWQTKDVNPSDATHLRRLKFDVTAHIKSPGKWIVEWDYTRGQDGLDIVRTALYAAASANEPEDQWRQLTVDEHRAFTGAADRNNRYELEIESLPPRGVLFIVADVFDQRDFDTFGQVWLLRDW